MAVVIGSARSDEKNKYSGGQRGDQKQTATPDYNGEVSLQNFYMHSKGWYVLRPKDPYVADRIAEKMKDACHNKNIGYSQSDRLDIILKGINTITATNCDCSSLVRECIIEATGRDVGNFTTANEVSVLEKSGLFEKKVAYVPGMPLQNGDVLVTKTKGHTAVVVQGETNPIQPTLFKGMSNFYVLAWQKYLNTLGYKLAESSIFSSEMDKVVKEYQKKNGLTPDGIIGPKTWATVGKGV